MRQAKYNADKTAIAPTINLAMKRLKSYSSRLPQQLKQLLVL